MISFSFLERWKDTFASHKVNILTFFGLLLTAILAFESGFLKGKMVASPPLVISIPEKKSEVQAPKPQDVETKPKETNKTVACLFVGSRNSNKYHKTTCATAKRIKEENKICFTSVEDAEKKGYSAGCLK